MSTARSALEDRIELQLDGQTAVVDTATGGTTTTVVDSGRPSSGEDFKHWWLSIDTDAGGAGAAPEGEERAVSAYDASTGTFTVPIAFTAAPASGDTYSVRRLVSKTFIDEVINQAIDEGQKMFVDVQVDETTRTQEDTVEYSLPTGTKHAYQIWLGIRDTLDNGTADSSTSTTLTDNSQSWDTNEYANQEVVIYDGTGAGQYRTISSNTTTALTVSTAWTTNPSTDSKYYIKDVSDDPKWQQITCARIDIAASEVQFPSELTNGEVLRIVYHKEYSALSSDSATTDMPATFIFYKALALIYAHLTGRRDRRDEASYLMGYYESQADKFAQQHRQTLPTDTMWEWPQTKAGWTSGPFVPSGRPAGRVE